MSYTTRWDTIALHPRPLRKRWKDWGRKGPPGAVSMRWREQTLAATDRAGGVSLSHMPDKTQPSIDAALVPWIARDAMLLFDGAPQYEAIARARKLGFKVLINGQRGRSTPASFHLNTGKWYPLLVEIVSASVLRTGE